MNALHKFLFAVLIFPLLGSHFAWGKEGGELGNARFIPYTNRVVEFSTKYPETWQVIEFGQSTLFEEVADEKKKPGLSVTITHVKGVETLVDLRRNLHIFGAQSKWKAVLVGGIAGYEAKTAKGMAMYLLRKPEEIVSIHYKHGDRVFVAGYIRRILKEMKF